MKPWIYAAVISFQQNKSKVRGRKHSHSFSPKLFTHRDKNSSLGFVLAVTFSMILMIADHQYQSTEKIRGAFSVLVSPLQFAVDYPVRVIGWIQSLVGSKKLLINENMQLRYRQTMLEAQLQKLLVIRDENLQLKELLLASPSAKLKTMAAQILAVDMSNLRQLLVLNKGKRNGVFVGQPVLDAKGVMGQIIDVGLMTSTVLLISDSKCAVPVRNNRTGERAILMGNNDITKLSLINLPKTSSITKGDLLVTSGLGRRYPEGYPVGVVDEVKNIPGEEFIRVEVHPLALLNRSRLALLIWPDEEHELLTLQINERLNAIKELG